jgi:hypothetical protein
MRQVTSREASHQDLEQRVKDLEQMVQELTRRPVLTVHMSDGQRSTMGSSYDWGFSVLWMTTIGKLPQVKEIITIL